jgi:hypothetical protein
MAASFIPPTQIGCFSTDATNFPNFDDVTISFVTGSIAILPRRCKRRSTPPIPIFRISSNQDLIVTRSPLLRIALSATLSAGVAPMIAKSIARLCARIFDFSAKSEIFATALPLAS